jgi:rod shape-determining protein MreC
MLLFAISLALTILNNSYHQSKYFNSTNFVTGNLFKWRNSVTQYFNLRSQNEALLQENERLRYIISNLPDQVVMVSDSIEKELGMYNIYTAKVYKNSYALPNNYITINKGSKDGLEQDFGVFTSQGVLGIVDDVSNSFSRVQSVLNTKSRINAQLKNSNHIGSLRWNGKSSELVQLVDVSKFAQIKVGDTIVTGGQSTIFPQGILIGAILDFKVDQGGDTYTIDVKLFNDMTNIGHVYVVENKAAEEIKSLDIN